MQSPQMTSLMKRYGVTTQKALLRAIRDESNEETFDPATDPPEYKCTLRIASILLDGMLDAEYQRIEGGAYADR